MVLEEIESLSKTTKLLLLDSLLQEVCIDSGSHVSHNLLYSGLKKAHSKKKSFSNRTTYNLIYVVEIHHLTKHPPAGSIGSDSVRVSPMHICFAYGYMGIQFFQYHSYREKAVWNFFTSFYQLHFSLSLLPAPVSKLLIICKSVSLLFCSSWWTNMIYCVTLSAIYIPILRSQSF